MNTGEQSIELLRAMAARLGDDEQFMAHALAVYQQRARLDDAALARELKTAPEMLVRLALCRRPAADAPDFAAQVGVLAEFALIDEARLARVIRQADRWLAEASRHGKAAGWWERLFGSLRAQPGFGPRLALAGVAFVCLLLFGALFWRAWLTASEPPAPPQPQEIVQHHPQPTLSPNIAESPRANGEVIVSPRPDAKPALPTRLIDLRKHPVQRDAARVGETIRPLPPSRLRLALLLPADRDKGAYRVSLLGEDDQVLMTTPAHSPDGKRLSVIFDLRRLAGRSCSLQIAHLDHPDEAPDTRSVKIARVAH